MADIYPLTIILTRYGGVYEGGEYAAFNCYPNQIPRAAQGDDISCSQWWEANSDLVGVGDTAEDALADLRLKMRDETFSIHTKRVFRDY